MVITVKKSIQPLMILGYDIKTNKCEHYIWIRYIHENGDIFYSKNLCYDVNFYCRMMKAEFNKI
jgi:hypothetical protein